MPELRRDPIIGRWVIISTERAKRPGDFKLEEEHIQSYFYKTKLFLRIFLLKM